MPRHLCLVLLSCSLLIGCEQPQSLSPLDKQSLILAFGNSLTRGTGTQIENSYPAVLERSTGISVLNAGIPGEVTREGLARLPELLRTHSPDLVVLTHGGNDILRRKSSTAARNNLEQMILMIRASGAEVVMLGVPQFGLFPSAAPWYEELAELHQIPYDGDIIPDLEKSPRHKSDPIHFNAEGYRLMAEAVETLLREHGALAY